MKLLWIVNSQLNKLSEYLNQKPGSGLWMDALLNDFQGQSNYQIVVATTIKTKKTVRMIDDNITYYALPDQYPSLYNENKSSNIAAWRDLLQNEKPDLIQVWGSEFTHGLCALRVSGSVPAVIYMQGFLGSIAKYYFAGITENELRRTVTFRDFIKKDSIIQQQRKYARSSLKETEMFRLSGRIISENEWCNANVRSIASNIKIYTCPLSINETFVHHKWSLEKTERHSIMCTASGYPIKGLHMVMRALNLLRKRYPDIKLYVPGPAQVSDGTLQWRIRKRGYTKYIEALIKELDIGQHITWLGQIHQEDLAEQYERTHVFVMSSAIENHSSSLKEAMMVGTPSVSSDVGGISEYVIHGENGFIYRFEEYELLAEYIGRIFDDDNLAQRLSDNERISIRNLHDARHIHSQIVEIYQQILEEL